MIYSVTVWLEDGAHEYDGITSIALVEGCLVLENLDEGVPYFGVGIPIETIEYWEASEMNTPTILH